MQSEHTEGYAAMSATMQALAKKQPGFLGITSVREEIGVTISYWESLEAIKRWKSNLQHKKAQERGKLQWYDFYKIEICKVAQSYFFRREH